eukprot:10199424-Lingulodinium_polyedra.AAC.1
MIGHSTVTTRIGQYYELPKAPAVVVVTDCEGLFDVVNRSQSAGLGLAEKRTMGQLRSPTS